MSGFDRTSHDDVSRTYPETLEENYKGRITLLSDSRCAKVIFALFDEFHERAENICSHICEIMKQAAVRAFFNRAAEE